MTARVGTHNPRTVYVDMPDGRSLFVACAMSDGMQQWIAAALHALPPDEEALAGCPDARRDS